MQRSKGMKREPNPIGSSILLLGIFFMNLLFFSLLVTTALFLFGISVSAANLLLAIALSIAVCFWFSEKSISQTVVIVFMGLVILSASILICAHAYDGSWDGNRYHMAMTGMMKYGWNPLRETFYDFADANFDFLSEITETWYDAYPKGSEIWAACVYAVTGNIETGKSFNLLSLIAVFLIGYSFLNEIGILRHWQSALCAFFCVCHPVSLSQLLTYYNDGFLWQTLLLCMICLLYLSFFENGRWSRLCFYLIFIDMNIGFNIKFSALIYFAILCLTFYGYWVVKRLRKGENFLLAILCGHSLGLFILSVLSGTLVTGATSYVVNTIRYRNPVYTMIGEGASDIVAAQVPAVYREMSNPVRFICSLFSRVNNNRELDVVEWKMPYLFDGGEVNTAQGVDTRISGWGILFGGIFLTSLAVILYALIKHRHPHSVQRQTAWQLTVLLLAVFTGSICVVPGLFWARYCGVLFYIPVAALIFLFARVKRVEGSSAKVPSVLAGVLSMVLFCNMAPNLYKVYQDLGPNYDKTLQSLEKFQALTQREPVVVGYDYRFEGRFFTLYDMGIENWTYGKLDPDRQKQILAPNYCSPYYQVIGADTAEEFLDEIVPKKGQLILIAVKDEGSQALTPGIVARVRALGLKFDLEGEYRASYLGAVYGDTVLYESLSNEKISYSTELGEIALSLVSAGYKTGNTASIQIDSAEYALNRRGLNLVVYDTRQKKLIHSVCIDSYLDNKLTYLP